MLRRLMNRLRHRGNDDRPVVGESSPRDFKQDRKDNRQAALSEEDRAWQEASLQRDRDRQERDQPPPER